MEIKVSTENGRVPVTVLHLDGNLDASSYETLQSKADELINAGARYFLIDLSHSPFVSSAGLRVFHRMFTQLRSLHPDTNLSEDEMKQGIREGTYKSPHLKLLNLSPETKSSFEMSGFDMYIETFTDFKTAVASF